MRLADIEVVTLNNDGRSDFRFPYRDKQLKEACDKEATYHRNREQHWSSEADRLEAEIREKGLELTEQQVTGGAQFGAKVDQILAGQLGTARQRRDHHRSSAENYEAYAGAFTPSPEQVRYLTIDDIRFFAIYIERPE